MLSQFGVAFVCSVRRSIIRLFIEEPKRDQVFCVFELKRDQREENRNIKRRRERRLETERQTGRIKRDNLTDRQTDRQTDIECGSELVQP